MDFYRKDFETALGHFKAAARLKPEDSYSLYKLGRTYLEQDKYDLAIRQFQKAVKLVIMHLTKLLFHIDGPRKRGYHG